MSTKSHIHKTYGTLKKPSFCIKGYAEIHIQRLVFEIEKGIWKILRLKIQTHVLVLWCPSLHIKVFFFEKNLISVFGGISKFFELIVSGQILAVLGRF
jgi:hypothetical protein